MKKLILTLGIVLSGIAFVQAQANESSDKNFTVTMNTINTACHLTADEMTKIKPFVTQFVQTKEANKQKLGGNPEGLKAANRTNNQQFKSNLQTVLSDDQMTQLTAYMKQQRAAAKKNNASYAPKGE
jgi:cytochrome c553